jgi:transcriptional regulator with XRE-family HTH domain
MKLGEILRFYRATHSMSMDEFSRRSGISKSYISLLEKDKHPKTGEPITPSVTIINQAATAMGLSFDDLFKMLNSDQKISFIEEMDNMVIEVEEPHEHDDVILNYFNRLSPTDDELDLIRNYRKLDKERKQIIDYILKMGSEAQDKTHA